MLKQLHESLITPFGYGAAEIHYLKIKPRVIAEQLLIPDDLTLGLIDYKFYVFHGEVHACSVMSSRVKGTHVYKHSLYDSNWKRIELAGCDGPDIECPVNYETIKKFCKDTASQFPFVRIDFYEVGGKLYFGEYTFTPVTLRPSYNVFKRFNEEWGNLMDLSVCQKV